MSSSQVLISILLFTDDIALIASSQEGLQRQLDALATFCDRRHLTVNLGKTKVIIFNGVKKTSDFHFLFKGEEIEIVSPYTYLGVHFSLFKASLQLAANPSASDQQRVWLPSPSGEAMFPTPFPGHLIQNEHHEHFDSSHSTLRLRDLGSLSPRVRLGFSRASPDSPFVPFH